MTSINKIVCLGDGHGFETLGKRTPRLPDGTIMKENEFNSIVVHKLAVRLLHKGFTVFYAAPTVSDIPLSERVATANAKKADIYVSVHANASGSGEFNSGQGVETFCYKFGGNAEKLARAVHAQLIKGTKQKDRGVKEGNFQVLRQTKMPAILVEAAFMTNLEEAKLLASDKFREEVAEEIYKGICAYYGLQS